MTESTVAAGQPGLPTQTLPSSGPAPGGGMLVGYTPVAMTKRAAMIRKLMFRQWLGVGISLLISVVWWLIFRPEVDSLLFWLLIASVALSLARVVITGVRLWRARRTIGRIPLGPAFQIDNHGVVLATVGTGERIGWPDIRVVKGRGKLFNPGPRLEFGWQPDGHWSVPIIQLDAAPKSIDSALRAFSLGRFGLDLSAVDDIW